MWPHRLTVELNVIHIWCMTLLSSGCLHDVDLIIYLYISVDSNISDVDDLSLETIVYMLYRLNLGVNFSNFEGLGSQSKLQQIHNYHCWPHISRPNTFLKLILFSRSAVVGVEHCSSAPLGVRGLSIPTVVNHVAIEKSNFLRWDT